MELIIEQYLLLFHHCPLPNLGTLQLRYTLAEVKMGEGSITAPTPVVVFKSVTQNENRFLKYISAQLEIDLETARQKLTDFINSIKFLDQTQEKKINVIGKFYPDHSGEICFKSFILPENFLPLANAERVIHPDAVHQIRVGDRELSNEYMSEQILLLKNKKKNIWWIILIAFFSIALIAAVIIFLMTQNSIILK
jgi:hypothetical protein